MVSKTRLRTKNLPLQDLPLIVHANRMRPARVAEIVRHHLAELLLRINFHHRDLENSHLITVSEVSLTPDLKNADVLVYPLHHERHHPSDLEKKVVALNQCRGFIRSQLAKKMTQKTTPALRFLIDTRFDCATHIDILLAKNSTTNLQD